MIAIRFSNKRVLGISLAVGLMASIAVLFQNCGGFVPANMSGNSTLASSSGVNSSANPTPTPAPTATPITGSVQLKWVEPYTGMPANYVIEESTDGGNSYFQAAIVTGSSISSSATDSLGNPITIAQYKVTGLTPQTTYYFRVRSSNAAGQSNPTAAVIAVAQAH